MKVEEWLGSGNQLGIDIWNKKYRDNNETFDEWMDRVSGGNDAIKQLIIKKKFLPAGRIMANRGLSKKDRYSRRKVTYSNCYVVTPPEDNIESIYECATKLARTYSYGGGCGVDISKLSPRGAKINNSAKETTGAVSFMELFNMTTDLIGQNGRRGAMMISISCDHPDLEEFIDIKSDLSKINKANISVRITDDFMKAVENDEPYTLSFTREETGETIEKIVSAKAIFRKLCEGNWRMAEPGILFWDNIRNYNLLSEDSKFEYAGTNPCAEEPLPAGGSCLLGSLNLAEFVKDGNFDFDDFASAVVTSVTYLNEILDEGLMLHPLNEQRESVKAWRQIGLGVCGVADMLIKMGIRYGSTDSINICDEIGKWLINYAMLGSANLAVSDGPYPMYTYDIVSKSEFYKNNVWDTTDKAVRRYGLRNSQLLTIAPTGTISTMIGRSGGMEPIFANYYERKTESLHGEDRYYKVYTPIVKEYMEANGITDEKDLPDYFITARDINYRDRINMQSVWQSHIDASISSTINVPNEFTVDDVCDLYMHAWKNGLKGATIFREGCDRGAVLSTNKKGDTKDASETSAETLSEPVGGLKRGEVIKCSDEYIGLKRTLTTGCGSLHCKAYFDPETKELREVFLSKGSQGGCNSFMIGLSRMISVALRGGVSAENVIDQLESSPVCTSYDRRKMKKGDTSKGICCPSAVGYALRDMCKQFDKLFFVGDGVTKDILTIETCEEVVSKEVAESKYESGVKCPDCGTDLVFEGGCNTCKSCGYSDCSG